MTAYPSSIVSFTRPQHTDPGNDGSATDAVIVIDAIMDEIEAIETILGTNPDGVTANTVVERLDAMTVTLGLKATDTAVVHNTGNETIAGTKTFSSAIVFSGSATLATHLVPKGQMDTALALKADASTVTTQLASKASLDGTGKVASSDLQTLGLPISAPSALVLGTVIPFMIAGYTRTIDKVVLILDSPPVGSSAIAVIKVRSHTATGATTVGTATFTAETGVRQTVTGINTALGPMDRMWVEITQVGSQYPGAGLLGYATGPDGTIPSAITAPGAPSISVSWSSPIATITITPGTGNYNRYEVYRDIGSGAERIGGFDRSTTVFAYTSPTPTATTSYWVRALNDDNASVKSNIPVISPVAHDWQYLFTGTANTALDSADWLSVYLGAGGTTAPSILKNGDGYARFTSGNNGGFNDLDKAFAKSDVPITTGYPQTWSGEFKCGGGSGEINVFLLVDTTTGTPTQPANRVQIQMKSQTVKLFYRVSTYNSGTTTNGFVYNRPATLASGDRRAWEIKAYVSGSNVVIEYRDWDAVSGSRPSSATASTTDLATHFPTAGALWLGIVGGNSAAAVTHYMGPITGDIA